MNLNNNINRILKERNMRQLDLARKAKLPPSTVSRICCGGPVKVDTFVKICRALGVDSSELLKGDL